MASEIRVNKINNRAGLGTVTYTDTGIIVSGIVTCTEISGLNASEYCWCLNICQSIRYQW